MSCICCSIVSSFFCLLQHCRAISSSHLAYAHFSSAAAKHIAYHVQLALGSRCMRCISESSNSRRPLGQHSFSQSRKVLFRFHPQPSPPRLLPAPTPPFPRPLRRSPHHAYLSIKTSCSSNQILFMHYAITFAHTAAPSRYLSLLLVVLAHLHTHLNAP